MPFRIEIPLTDPPPEASTLLQRVAVVVDFFLPEECAQDLDQKRRARLVINFGLEGTVFGLAYALFYFLIGHVWGALIIVGCTAVFAAAPWYLRRTHALDRTAHGLIATMAAGFTALTVIEGGIHSHAVAWLASVPLCALLMLGVRPACGWAGVSLLGGLTIAGLTYYGFDFRPLYDPRWSLLVDAAGNVGIIAFLFVLGLVFELSRATAFEKMQQSLDLYIASNEQLEHLNNEKTEFLGMAAHDLRNPLSGIIGFAELLEMNADEKVAKRGRSIGAAGRQMLELINDLLDANAIEQGRYASDIEPLDLRALVDTSVQRHLTASTRKNIPLTFVDGAPCWVHADRKATLQILDNLVSNALKYSPPGTEVTLTVETRDGVARFFIKDQGPGISAEDQKKLFQKHTKLSARPTGGEGSVGLGLSIVKKLAQAMKGDVTCESTAGAGSTFIVQWPAAPVPAEAVRPAAATPRQPSGFRARASGFFNPLGAAPKATEPARAERN